VMMTLVMVALAFVRRHVPRQGAAPTPAYTGQPTPQKI
jgi:hypothetical protein